MRGVKNHFNKIAGTYDSGKRRYSFYYLSLKKLLLKLIGKHKKVLEFGCGTGDLLNYLEPKYGYGYDISSKMIAVSKSKYSNSKYLTFSTKLPKKTFDYIFLSDVIEHLENPKKELEKLTKIMDSKSKLIITMANPLWEPALMLWEKLGWKMKEGPHTRIMNHELRIMIEKSGMKILKHDYTLLMPIRIPVLTEFINKYLEKSFKRLAFIEYFIAKREH